MFSPRWITLEGGGIPERRGPRSGGMSLSKALPNCAAKKQWLQIYGKITLLRF
jgi:hypothetical protein